jgi:hypothetical protein
MLKIAKDLNSVISGLEDIGKYVEARELHNVFIKLSQIPPGVGVGMAAGGAGAKMGAGMVAGNANNPSGNFQKLIEDYKNRFTQELKTTNNSNTPATSEYYKSIMQGNSLTEPEKLAFRAQAYRIRLEVRNQMYGMGGLKDPKSQMYKGQQQAIDDYKNATQGNINLLVENVVKVSGLYNEKSYMNVDQYFPLIMSSIEQQISQRINPNERPKYLQSAKALVGTYINRQKAVLQNSAMQPR